MCPLPVPVPVPVPLPDDISWRSNEPQAAIAEWDTDSHGLTRFALLAFVGRSPRLNPPYPGAVEPYDRELTISSRI